VSTFIHETSRFKRHMRSLPERLALSKQEAKEAVTEILHAIDLLRENGTLPAEYGYALHPLEREPWRGLMEFHALDDVLVVYADLTQKGTIRLLGIYNHALLSSGKMDS
jgi:mRNA-degrading endonuclease YafQ of YafQ-DinJ toxin-antitoxin module